MARQATRKHKETFDDFLGRFGLRLAALRKRRGLTQEQLAEVLDVVPSYLAKLETAARRPSFELLWQLAHALGAKPKELLDFDESADWEGTDREQGWEEFRGLLHGTKAEDVQLLVGLAKKVWRG